MYENLFTLYFILQVDILFLTFLTCLWIFRSSDGLRLIGKILLLQGKTWFGFCIPIKMHLQSRFRIFLIVHLQGQKVIQLYVVCANLFEALFLFCCTISPQAWFWAVYELIVLVIDSIFILEGSSMLYFTCTFRQCFRIGLTGIHFALLLGLGLHPLEHEQTVSCLGHL